MGIGDAFLGADLLANAIQAALAGKSDLDTTLASYEAEFRDRTMRVFEYTLRAAALNDPSSTIPLYAKVGQSQEETIKFMDVLAGTMDFKKFFNPSNISRLLT